MAITRKPKQDGPKEEGRRKSSVDAFIGGGLSYHEEPDPEQICAFTMRMPKATRDRIDAALKKIPKHRRPTRQEWIIETCTERLDRE